MGVVTRDRPMSEVCYICHDTIGDDGELCVDLGCGCTASKCHVSCAARWHLSKGAVDMRLCKEKGMFVCNPSVRCDVCNHVLGERYANALINATLSLPLDATEPSMIARVRREFFESASDGKY